MMTNANDQEQVPQSDEVVPEQFRTLAFVNSGDTLTIKQEGGDVEAIITVHPVFVRGLIAALTKIADANDW